MKKMFVVLFAMTLAMSARGQAVGTIYINLERMPVPEGTPDHLEYEAGKSSLNDAGKAYLQYFIDKYARDLTTKDGVIMKIDPVPGAKDKNNLNDKVGLKRVDAVAQYVYKKSDIRLGKAVMDGNAIVFGMTGRHK
ncbi:MAG: hypothetical protein JST14_09335 [Bacteroidetes bacterium]|nr:hypothetical protein [Bacteroidota bacterium]MBS1978884.1 hypothetical protein [Bacteroidota bacterium]